MMILGSQSGVVFELRLTGERSLQIITQDDVERLMSIMAGSVSIWILKYLVKIG